MPVLQPHLSRINVSSLFQHVSNKTRSTHLWKPTFLTCPHTVQYSSTGSLQGFLAICFRSSNPVGTCETSEITRTLTIQGSQHIHLTGSKIWWFLWTQVFLEAACWSSLGNWSKATLQVPFKNNLCGRQALRICHLSIPRQSSAFRTVPDYDWKILKALPAKICKWYVYYRNIMEYLRQTTESY